MNKRKTTRCAVYTRKSSEEGLEQEFNSLDAQRESGQAYIASQKHDGWTCLPDNYDDGGYSGGSMDRPALRRLLADIAAGKIDVVVVYKVDRLSRSLLDFARMMEIFDKHHVAFVSVTQQFNTTSSMGRLVLNVLLSFAQFEREIISERTRDKIAAARRKGKWSGGMPLLGYDVPSPGSRLVLNEPEAEQVRAIFALYLHRQSLRLVLDELDRRGWRTKEWRTRKGQVRGGKPFSKSSLHLLLSNPAYLGQVRYKRELHPGEHAAIIDEATWQQVQDLLRRPVRDGRLARQPSDALLKGLLHCQACACAMTPSHTVKGSKRYRYYVCVHTQKRGRQHCPTRSVPAAQIEQFVLRQLADLARDPALWQAHLAQTRGQEQARLNELEAERAALETTKVLTNQDIRRLLDQIAKEGENTGLITHLAGMQEQMRNLEQRLTENHDTIITLRRTVITDQELAQALDKVAASGPLPASEQARLLHLLLQRIDYSPQGQLSLAFNAAGIKTLTNPETSI